MFAFLNVNFKTGKVAHLPTALFGRSPLLPTRRSAYLLDDHSWVSAVPLFWIWQPPANFSTSSWSCDCSPKNHSICLTPRSLCKPWVCQKVLSFLSPFQIMCFHSATYRKTSKILMHIFNLVLGLIFLPLNCQLNKLLPSLVLTYVCPDLALG